MVCRCVLALMAIFLLGSLSASSQISSSEGSDYPLNISANVSINGADNDMIDFGFCIFGTIGDLVWNDSNKNSIYDVGELVLPGINVSLYDAKSGEHLISTSSNESGNYTFEVCYGIYRVIVAEDKYVPTTSYKGNPYIILYPDNDFWYPTTDYLYLVIIDKSNPINKSIDFGLKHGE